jgi:hypothetical protein
MMFEQTFETSATPHITITECLRNLVVRGSEDVRVTLRLRGSADDVDLEREGETFTLAARADCFLTCPPATTLTIGTAHGNLKVQRVEGPVTIEAVHGNATLRAIGPTAVERTLGNLSVHQVAGDLRAHTTGGNARLRQVEGSLSLGQVSGSLTVEGLHAGLSAEQVRGNARLGPPFTPGATYRLSASGSLTVHLPADASLRLALTAAGRVHSHVPGLALEELDGETRAMLGAGEASLEAQVGGHASLRPVEPQGPTEGIPLDWVADLEGLGAQIEARVAEAMAEMEERLAEGLGRIDSEEIRREMERATERTLRAAERATEQARRTAEREAERARMRAERAERRWQRASGRRPRPREAATDEEMLRVLRLLEEGKITPEQASDLLAALEGE